MSRLCGLIDRHGPFASSSEVVDLVRTQPAYALKRFLDYKFFKGYGLVRIDNQRLVLAWLDNRSIHIARLLHQHLCEANSMVLSVSQIHQMAEYLIGSLVPRGIGTTEYPSIFYLMISAPGIQSRQKYPAYIALDGWLTLNTPLPRSALDSVVEFRDLEPNHITAIRKDNQQKIDYLNAMRHVITEVQLTRVEADDIRLIEAQLHKTDRIQTERENILIHSTTKIAVGGTKRQQIRLPAALGGNKTHLPWIVKCAELVLNRIIRYGPDIGRDWIFDQICVTGLVDKTSVDILGTKEICHSGHMPFDSNPVNVTTGTNQVNQTQKSCSTFKLFGCQCQTGQCILKTAWIENHEYFLVFAEREFKNPMSKYSHCTDVREVRVELALDTLITCARYYYDAPQHLILYALGF